MWSSTLNIKSRPDLSQHRSVSYLTARELEETAVLFSVA